MAKPMAIEEEILAAGVLQTDEFIAHNGQVGNRKIDMEVVLHPDSPHQELALKIAKLLANLIRPHEPELVIPIPQGANYLGELVGRELGLRVVNLLWSDEPYRHLGYADPHDQIVVGEAAKIALIDDVLRTGSALGEAVEAINLGRKKLIAGVVWDRSDPAIRRSPRPVEAVVTSYLPLWVDE